MYRINRWVLWVAAALLLAGVLTPLTLALPLSWQGPIVLAAIAVICVVAALAIARRT
jgi:hypothetical protein